MQDAVLKAAGVCTASVGARCGLKVWVWVLAGCRLEPTCQQGGSEHGLASHGADRRDVFAKLDGEFSTLPQPDATGTRARVNSMSASVAGRAFSCFVVLFFHIFCELRLGGYGPLSHCDYR